MNYRLHSGRLVKAQAARFARELSNAPACPAIPFQAVIADPQARAEERFPHLPGLIQQCDEQDPASRMLAFSSPAVERGQRNGCRRRGTLAPMKAVADEAARYGA